MTDDKGAGEGPYIHTLAAYYLPCEANCPACAYEAGRKAEREWYAGMVLNAVYASYMEYSEKHGMDENWRDGIARDAFKMADAMLRAGKGEK